MSYILDALKRAEAERSRGEIPDLHAQPLGDLPAAEAATPGRGRAAWLAGGAVLLLLGGAAGWWLSHDATSTAAPTVVALSGSVQPSDRAGSVAASATLASTAPPPPIAAASAAVPVVRSTPMITFTPAASPDAAVVTAPAVSSKAKLVAASTAKGDALALSAPSPATGVAPTTSNSPAANPTGAAPAAAPASSGVATNDALPPNAPAAEERVVALRDLPDDVRASLPPLSVAGATYSENPASRMLIINGKLVHEGDRLTPELTLQQIRLRSAVLSYRGIRFSISY